MKKKWLLLLMSAACALSLSACGDPNDGKKPDGPDNPGIVDPIDKPATGISLNKNSLMLGVGKSEKLTATVTPADTTDEIEWSTGNAGIATVSDGTVTAIAAGETTVTVKAGTKTATCTVTVSAESVPATGITLDRTTVEIRCGGTATLTATVTPEDSTDTVQWSAVDTNVATVNNGVVTAVGVGETVVTAKVGNFTAECTVTVVSDNATEQGYIWTENFKDRDQMPGYLFVNAAGGGNAVVNEEGMRVTTGRESGRKIFVEHTFDEAIDGTFRVQMRVKVGNVKPFNDILFFLTETGENVATIAICEGKYYNNHSGNTGNNGWAAMNDFEVKPNTWQDVELIFDTEKGTFDLYVSDGENSASMLKQPLRVPANKDLIKRFRFGGDMNDIDMTLEYIKISNVTGPELSVTQPAEGFELDLNDPECDGTYTLEYSATSPVQDTVTYAVTCDKTSGYTIGEDKKTVTFTAMGTYTFTVTATDKYGSASKTVTVNVKGEKIAPTINLVSEESAELSLQAQGGAKYTFEYTVAGSPAPTESVEYDGNMPFSTDAENDVIKSGTTVTFNIAGTYTFTIEANNGDATVQKKVTIVVNDLYAVPSDISADKVLYTNGFDTESDQAKLIDNKNASGSVSYENGKMHITTTDKSGNYLFDLPFGHDLYGLTSVEMKFSITGINFTNLMFFQPENSSATQAATACFCVQGGKLKYNSDGKNWMDVKYGNLSVAVQYGETYSLRAALDMNNKKAHLYLAGNEINLLNASNGNELVAPLALGGKELYFGSYDFRMPANSIATLRTGTSNSQIDYTIDDIRVNLLSPKLTVNAKKALIQNFTGNETYTFDYVTETGATVNITCDDESVTVTDGVASFANVGQYMFTITATKGGLYTCDTVFVEVVAESVPAEKTYCDVDFTVDKSTDHLRGKTSTTFDGKYEFTDKGLRLETVNATGNIYWKYDMGEILSGIVTTEIDFYIGNNKHMINLLFWFPNLNTGDNQPTNYAIGDSSNNHLKFRNDKEGGTGWKDITYNGKYIELLKDVPYKLKVTHDFDNNIDYLYLTYESIDLGGTIVNEGGEIYLGTRLFRNNDKPAQVISIGIDNKKGCDFTLNRVKIYKSNIPVFVNESTEKSLTLENGTATLSASEIESTYSIVGNADAVNVVCKNAAGEIVDLALNGDLIFDTAGVYTITVTAENMIGSSTHTVTVNVVES